MKVEFSVPNLVSKGTMFKKKMKLVNKISFPAQGQETVKKIYENTVDRRRYAGPARPRKNGRYLYRFF